MPSKQKKVYVVGAGLAGSECAYQLAQKGYQVQLIEMRGKKSTPAHKTDLFAELVCSNSFGSMTDYSAPGQLKREASLLGSMILDAAQKAHVPSGMALGVDRQVFSEEVTSRLRHHPNISIETRCVESIDEIPRPAVIATGPLTDESLAQSILEHFNNEFLYFFDAIAPIVDTDSINMNIAWKADRWDKGTGDYINCPMNKEQYENFVAAIKDARKVEFKEFEKDTPYFEGCMPIEEIVSRGDETLRFGPLSPKGLFNPRTGKREHAVVQLRQDNKEGTAYNLVGFQTKMAYPEQKRVFQMIPGLEEADFLKLGSIHRNLYINSPKVLSATLASRKDPMLFFAGQITGVEGYFESTCIGLMVARFIDNFLSDQPVRFPPRASAFGSLLTAITEEKEDFQPTNINFGLFPELSDVTKKIGKRERRDEKIRRAQIALEKWFETSQ